MVGKPILYNLNLLVRNFSGSRSRLKVYLILTRVCHGPTPAGRRIFFVIQRAAPWPGPPSFEFLMGLSPARPIKSLEDGPWPSPAHQFFRSRRAATRPGPSNSKLYRPDPARPGPSIFQMCRPGQAHDIRSEAYTGSIWAGPPSPWAGPCVTPH